MLATVDKNQEHPNGQKDGNRAHTILWFFSHSQREGLHVGIYVNVENKDYLTLPQTRHYVQFHGGKINICVFPSNSHF